MDRYPGAACQSLASTASGKLVTPGLVDLHSHVYPYGSAIGIPADEMVPFQATTTVVSAGDAGANNFAAFRRLIVAQTRTRTYAFVHIANIGLAGFPVPELFNINYADVTTAAERRENAEWWRHQVAMSRNVSQARPGAAAGAMPPARWPAPRQGQCHMAACIAAS